MEKMSARTKRPRFFIISSVVVLCLILIAVLFLIKYANVIAKSGIEKALGRDFSIGRIELTWGSVRVKDVVMKNSAGKEVIRVEGLRVRADFMGLLRKKYIISSVFVEKPYIYAEVDNKGHLVSPVFPEGETAARRDRGKGKEAHPPETAKPPVILKKIIVVEGSVDYLDRKSPRVPVLTRVRHINMEMRDLTIPFTNDLTRYTLNATIPEGRGGATVKSDGRIRLESKDADCKASVRDLDITHFKPYFDRGRSVNITRGLLDLDVRAKVVSRKIHAPGKAVLKDLAFESGHSVGDQFMGVPIAVVAAFLKKSGDRIPVDFVIAGDLDNPRFNIAENFMSRLSFGLAEKLGLSVKDIGQSVFGLGTEGTKKVGEGIECIGEGIKKMFKK
jgi:hypothetical protein